MAIKFLQISDTHLGAKLTGLPTPIAEQLREDVRAVIRGSFEQARAGGLDIVLMPGDLFEAGGSDPAAELRFIYEQCAALAPVPVVIAPGNHDPYGSDSPYAQVPVPQNVVLFTSPKLTTVETSAGPVTGRAVQASSPYSDLDMTELPAPGNEVSLLVLHASVLHAADGRSHQHTVAKTTAQALKATGYSYAALGHYHNLVRFDQPGGDRAFAAYAGCPQGLGWDEPGSKGYLVGELELDGARLSFVAAARHEWRKVRLELPPEYASDAQARLSASIEQLKSEISAGELLALSVAGRWPETLSKALMAQVEAVAGQAWHARPVDWSRSEWLPELPDYGAGEALDIFLARCDEGIAAGGDDAAAWQLARYFGRRLLGGAELPGEVAL